MKHRKSVERARRFCSALATETRAARIGGWQSRPSPNRLGMPGEDAIELADDCAREGLVMHDQSQHTADDRKAVTRPHSVTLKEAGRALAKGK
ncbi:hypothetical protein [Reyranella sp.]|uniref:hypothetical protein n=1 Tax=Reyranella sp. TaxID=1929291 RepID=UPI003D13E6C7